jgi:ribosomal protein S18 acetylase RimI-like enzyme
MSQELPIPTTATAALHAALAAIGAATPTGFRQDIAPGVTAYATGTAMSSMNGIAIDRAVATTPLASIRETVARLQSTGLPWSMQVFGVGPSLDHELKASEFSSGEDTPTYVRDLAYLQEPQTAAAGFKLSLVRDSVDRDDFARVLGRAFGADATLGAPFVDAAVLEDPLTFAYLGREDGFPVATGMTIIAGAWAGIFAIATAEAYRRHGYGELMTLQLCRVAQAHGARVAYLQASSLGLPLYTRMGFHDANDSTTYRRPRALSI